jgi:hypothetical protein
MPHTIASQENKKAEKQQQLCREKKKPQEKINDVNNFSIF